MSSNSLPHKGQDASQHNPPTAHRNNLHILSGHQAVLRRLKAWHRWEQDKKRSFVDYLLRTSPAIIPQPALPSDDDLLSLAQHYFPLRDELEITICDFQEAEDGVCRVEPHVTTLKHLEQYLVEKPTSVLFRWIHLPVGAGWLNQEILLGLNDRKSATDSIPVKTVHFKVVSLRDIDIVQDQLDVFNLLQDVPGPLKQQLQNTWASTEVFRNIPPGNVNFWRAAASDMPGPLTQTSMKGPNRLPRWQTSKDFLSTTQCLSRHPDYKKLILTTDNMTCASRSDGKGPHISKVTGLIQTGVLLTMLSSKGLNHLRTSRTKTPWPNVVLSPAEYVLGSRAFEWRPLDYVNPASGDVSMEHLSHNHFVELFLFSLVLDFHASPTAVELELSGLEEAYEQIVQELKNKSTRHLRRQESLILVQDLIACMNEISQLHKVQENKQQFLRSLLRNFPTFPPTSPDANPSGDFDPIEEYLRESRYILIKSQLDSQDENSERLPLLSEELKSSLDVFFQLKTIEQNEMALLAESNNQAILVFTVVTVVFLPLSFFTSYFGMNIQGITNTSKDERYFWMVCGPVTVSIVLLTLCFGFRKRFRDVLWSDQTFARAGA